MSALRTGILLLQGAVMYPVAMRFAMLHDPGLAAQRPEVREKRLRTGPVMFGALMLAAGLVLGQLPGISFFWMAILALGWSMKRHPSEFHRFATERRLPPKAIALDMVIVMAAGGVGLAVGTAIG